MRPTYIDRADAEKDALTCAAFVAERIKSNDGHADALLQVISRYLSLNESDLSAQLADTVADNFSRDNLLRAIAEHCAGVDDDEYAMQLADAIDDPLTRASAMERIALVKAQKQQFEKSMEIAETLENPQTVYSQNAFHHAAAGDDRAAENLFTKIDFPPLQAQTCIEIASAKLENEDNEGAVTWLERADRIIPEIFTDEERVNEYLLAAYSFIRAGRNDRAITLLSAARELVENSDTRNWRDQMYSRIADYYFQAGSSELADRALDRIEDNYWFALALEKFAAYKIKDENIDDAAADLEEAANLLLAQKQTEIYNTEWRDTLLRDIALGMVAVGKFERAMSLTASMAIPRARDEAHMHIAILCADRGEDAHGKDALNLIRDEYVKPAAKISVLNKFIRMNETDKARQMLVEVHSEIEDVPQLAAQIYNLNLLAKSADALGNREEGIGMLEEGLELVEQLKDDTYKVTYLISAYDTLREIEASLTEKGHATLRRIAGAAEL